MADNDELRNTRSVEARSHELLSIERAIELLAAEHPQAARYANLRLFGGKTNEEASRAMSISSRSGQRIWTLASAWLGSRVTR
jgi:hypothetical protein